MYMYLYLNFYIFVFVFVFVFVLYIFEEVFNCVIYFRCNMCPLAAQLAWNAGYRLLHIAQQLLANANTVSGKY